MQRSTKAGKAFWDWYANKNARLHTWQAHIPAQWRFCFLLWKQWWKIARDVSVMSAICIPLMFSQKIQDLKTHNILNQHSQNLSFLSSCSAHRGDATSEYSRRHRAPSAQLWRGNSCNSPLPLTFPGGEKKPSQSDKAVTSYWTLTHSCKFCRLSSTWCYPSQGNCCFYKVYTVLKHHGQKFE